MCLICILLLLIKLYVKDVYIATALIALCLVINSLVLIDSIPLLSLLINDCFEKLAPSWWWNQWLNIFRWSNLVIIIWLIHCAMAWRKPIFKILILIIELWRSLIKQTIILWWRLLLNEISGNISLKLLLKYFPIDLLDFLSELVTERLQLKLSILQILWKCLTTLILAPGWSVGIKIWIAVYHSISDIFCNIDDNAPSILSLWVLKIFQIDFFKLIDWQINW
jgi:hypothetical protein